MAAVETLRRGFDRFIIMGSQAGNNVSVVNRPPTGAFTTYGSGFATTTLTGGGPIVMGTHDSELLVLMLNPGEPNYSQGVDARHSLGPDWQRLVESGIRTCDRS